jgi:hypothetical protein
MLRPNAQATAATTEEEVDRPRQREPTVLPHTQHNLPQPANSARRMLCEP